MSNAIAMTADFERQKNIKASTYTLAIGAGLLLISIAFKMTLPPKEVPQNQEVIEISFPDEPPVEDVNLGNNDVGSGKVQPIVTGNPSSAPVSQDVSPSKGATSQQATKDFTEDNHRDAPAITKPSVPNTSKEINNNATEQSTANKPQLRKGAQMTSTRGSGNGGNTDLPGMNRPGSQGPGDGNGDKGVHNGNPNGRNYIQAKSVAIPPSSFTDDFKEGGTIMLDIEVNEDGKLVSASYQPSGSSLAKSTTQYSIALRRAKEITYPRMPNGFKQKLSFQFSVK